MPRGRGARAVRIIGVADGSELARWFVKPMLAVSVREVLGRVGREKR